MLLHANNILAKVCKMQTLSSIKKSHVFTANLPPDPAVPSPQAAAENPKITHTPRQVRNALFTYVKPQPNEESEVLAVSSVCLEDLGLDPAEANTAEFKALVSGNDVPYYREHHPWAQCYGGWQFGSWASQLGDGRAISLFEITNDKDQRFEVQLKGAGKTPYSRFADGNAVLRSSIREFLISEHLNALGISTTRALALVLLPKRQALRERVEPCAIVCRVAQTWLRIGTFDLLRHRGDRSLLLQLSQYCISHVFGGETNLLPGVPDRDRGNKYERLYREIVRRNAKLVASLQAYGFMNGVLNSDNTSIYGLSMDYGPFAFMDKFDPSYTPNHDDGGLRYSYKMQPTVFWWNLTRLGEALGELFGAGDNVESLFNRSDFLSGSIPEGEVEPILRNAERIIELVAAEFKEVFIAEYKSHMSRRLGFDIESKDELGFVSDTLDLMEQFELDFNHFFRRLSVPEPSAESILGLSKGNFGGAGREKAVQGIEAWLQLYRDILQSKGTDFAHDQRVARMKKANPHFVLRGWILDDVIQRVEMRGQRDILGNVMKMAVSPFEDAWHISKEVFHLCICRS